MCGFSLVATTQRRYGWLLLPMKSLRPNRYILSVEIPLHLILHSFVPKCLNHLHIHQEVSPTPGKDKYKFYEPK